MDQVTRIRGTAENAVRKATQRLRTLAERLRERRLKIQGRAGGESERSAGISNRPLDEEQREQQRVPPAGAAQGETDPALSPRPGMHAPPRDPAPKQRDPRHPRPDGD